MDVIFLFTEEPPEWAYRLEKFGYRVLKIDDADPWELEKNIVLVVGDRELAKKLSVEALTIEELRELLEWLEKPEVAGIR